MDPYIEASGAWSVFHHSFIGECGRYLNEQLPQNYVATVGDRVELVSEDDLGLVTARSIGPDVNVVRDRASSVQPGPAQSGRSNVATLEPSTLQQAVEWIDPPKQLYVQVLRVPEQEVVADIELLSPSNKRRGSEDRAAYLARRQMLFRHHVHLVELDLLRGGERIRMLTPLPSGDYYAFVTLWQDWHQCDVYAWSIRAALPTIPVPLRLEDGAVGLDLAAVFARTYDNGRFDRVIRYDKPVTDLPEADRTWAAEQAARPSR